MSDNQDNKNYSVGYKKPPKHGQFKKGQSGNWRGRPKGSKSKKRHWNEQMQQKVHISDSKGRHQVTFREALVLKLQQAVFKGDFKSMKWAIELDIKLNPDLYRNGTQDEMVARIKELESQLELSRRKEGGVLVVPPKMSEEEWIAETDRINALGEKALEDNKP